MFDNSIQFWGWFYVVEGPLGLCLILFVYIEVILFSLSLDILTPFNWSLISSSLIELEEFFPSFRITVDPIKGF